MIGDRWSDLLLVLRDVSVWVRVVRVVLYISCKSRTVGTFFSGDRGISSVYTVYTWKCQSPIKKSDRRLKGALSESLF